MTKKDQPPADEAGAMTGDVVRQLTPTEHADHSNPFARRDMSAHVNAGAVSIESDRAVAEAQGKLVIAKRFPRDEARCFQKIIDACSRKSLAEMAMYAYPRANQTITGPSIRLAEELARCWGNMSYGTRELSRKEGVSEMEAFAWDEETNVRSVQQFAVRHIRDTRSGSQALRDERDIYEVTANNAARRLRARILAIIPPDIIESALEQCRKTLAGTTDEPIADRVRKMVTAFAKHGVTPDQIETKLGHKLGETTPDDIVDLLAIYQSLKDGQSSVRDWFGGAPATPGQPEGTDAPVTRPTRLNAAVAKPATTPAAPPADAAPDGVGEDVREF